MTINVASSKDFNIGSIDGTDNTFIGNSSSGAGYEGFVLYSADNNINNTIISDNYIANNGTTGIYLKGTWSAPFSAVDYTLISGNALVNNNIYTDGDYSYNTIQDNTFNNNSSWTPIQIGLKPGDGTGDTVENNTITNGPTPYIINYTSNSTLRNQVTDANGGADFSSPDATNALSVQNALGSNILDVDTSNGAVNITEMYHRLVSYP